ncbi:ankyrin-2-like isoform X8 [Acipenser oxyrinchus oxyrinchus]|uniref:Ankyrin-2-like isoform X8 n=1 Tax=Acipenser oxyrinchus oxyrinchus TaxID=40147 RepID=A0AAD8FUG5_ACIOX|nr:ankyrin-2-like isoform X8 [Acipenser oxyrinchus oxyrinchus]
MWTLLTELLISLVLLGFFVLSCQNVLHIVNGSIRFVLKHIHQELDQELGEGEEGGDDEESVTTHVVRRRVMVKGDEVEDIPGGQFSEEQFTDEHGNIVTKKVGRRPHPTVPLSVCLSLPPPPPPHAALLCAQSEANEGKKGAQIVKRASLRRVKQ